MRFPTVCLVWFIPVLLLAADPSLTIQVDRPIQVLAPGATAVLTARAEGLRSPTITWVVRPTRINPLAATEGATLTATTGPKTTVRLTRRGVHQIEATATDGTTTLRRRTWVHVWDDQTVFAPGRVGANPGMLPPPSVRPLSPDPGPFQHPRLLITDEDWPEVRLRNDKDRFAKAGRDRLKEEVAERVDDPKHAIGGVVAALDAWARGAGPEPDAVAITQDLYGALHQAAHLAWLEAPPEVPVARCPPAVRDRRLFLARVTAAAARCQLAAQWDRPTRTLKTDVPAFISGLDKIGQGTDVNRYRDLPNVYDLAYDWMDEPQRTAVRDLLFAVGWARHFSSGFSWHPTHGEPGLPMGADAQNGDFGNLGDYGLLASLVIEGEEDRVSPDVRAVFGTPPPDSHAVRWMRPASADDPSAWPFATVATVNCLHRQLRMINEGFITPWGTWVTRGAYMGLSTGQFLPSSLAFARRGEDLFVTSYFYNAILTDVLMLQRGQKPKVSPFVSSDMYQFDHHDGGGPVNLFQVFAFKYRYPDDPLVDYSYRVALSGMWQWGTRLQSALWMSLYGVEPGVGGRSLDLAATAKAKGLLRLLGDPLHGTVLVRNGWSEDDLSVWFDADGSPGRGHQHAEKNSFALYALGRPWSSPPGYHVTIHDAQTGIAIQDPAHADEPITEGYVGLSPSSLGQMGKGHHPTPPGRLLEVREEVQGKVVRLVGDAKPAYDYAYSGEASHPTGHTLASFLYPGLTDYLDGLLPGSKASLEQQELRVSDPAFNPVRRAFRTLLVVRGKRPYVLCVDDIEKDGTQRNYRWFMNNASGFYPGGDLRFVDAAGKGVFSSMAIEPGATPTQAVLYHDPIDAGNRPGLPRLLVRELGATDTQSQPRLALDRRPPTEESAGRNFPYGVDNNTGKFTTIPTNRLLIDRRQVVAPGYVVLLFPFRTGETIPRTTWNEDRTELTIVTGSGTDRFRFDRSATDGRTRVEIVPVR